MPACVPFPSPPARRLPLLITPATTPSTQPHRSSCRAGGTTLESRASCTGPAPPRGRRVDHGDRARDPSGTGKSAALRLHGWAPERGERRIGSSQLDPWLAHLERRRAEGCENGLQLLRELREHGYAGGSRQVHKWLQSRRTKVAITTPRRWRDAIPGMTAPARPSCRRGASNCRDRRSSPGS